MIEGRIISYILRKRNVIEGEIKKKKRNHRDKSVLIFIQTNSLDTSFETNLVQLQRFSSQ